MANGKYYPPRKFMPGAPLPSLQGRDVDERSFGLARSAEFSVYLQHYLTDVFSPQSGARGIHLNKLKQSDENSHAYVYEVAGVPLWGHGMDYDTAGSGRADYIPVFDNSANAGKGADVFRWSGEADAPAGTSLTCKFTAGRTVGSPRSFDSFGFLNGGDNTTGLGGLSIGYFDESATYNALKLFNRSSAKKRTPIYFNGQYLLGSDLANANAQTFTLYDSAGLGNVWGVDGSGTVTHYYLTTMDDTLTVTSKTSSGAGIVVNAPSLGRCLTLNAGAGATILMNPAAGTHRNSVKMASIFQWGTDINNNGGNDFWFQNLSTGNAFMLCDVNDKMTLGTTNASGGVVVGVSGGKASFFGATTVVQQPNASQAGITAVTDANAKAALQAIYNLLHTYGLAPATA